MADVGRSVTAIVDFGFPLIGSVVLDIGSGNVVERRFSGGNVVLGLATGKVVVF